MRRFLESRLYAITNWPAEFIDEYLPLLKNFDYNKGSLNQSSFNHQVYAVDTTPLPPVHECAFSTEDVDELEQLINGGTDGSSYNVFLLHQRCNTVQIKFQIQSDYVVLGSEKSKHSRSSLVFCQKPHSDDISLAVIRFFAKCVFKHRETGEQMALWVAAVVMVHASCL